MDSHWEAIFTYANSIPDHPYLPNAEKPVHIFGETFDALKDRDQIAERLRSLFWMTYRKNFTPIFTQNGPTSDARWGCMHRCGQMMLAEAFTRIHLGRDWRWKPGCQDEAYCRLRRMFQDTKGALYSIQNITMLGMAVDKPIGSWFGPNTVAQVIKKLSAYDPSTNWYVHISVEDGVIVDEIKARCQNPRSFPSSLLSDAPHSLPTPNTPPAEGGVGSDWDLEAIKALFAEDPELLDPPPHVHSPVTRMLDEDFLEIVLPPTYESEQDPGHPPSTASPVPPNTALSEESAVTGERSRRQSVETDAEIPLTVWRPLLLFIPLRLGLHQPNPCYFNALKATLQLSHSVGIIGGRPSHAVWLVGTVGCDDVLCLDPHTTQPASQDALTAEDDATHHCDFPVRLPLQRLDPSMVLGFLCTTEEEFDQLCLALERDVLSPEASCGHPLFELHKSRPPNLPPLPSMMSNSRSERRVLDTFVEPVENELVSDASPSPPFASDPSKIVEAVNAVRAIWSKCNQVAEETVRSLTNVSGPTTNSGAEFEMV